MALELACYDLLPRELPSFARGFSAALIATSCCYPLDTVRRQIQARACIRTQQMCALPLFATAALASMSPYWGNGNSLARPATLFKRQSGVALVITKPFAMKRVACIPGEAV